MNTISIVLRVCLLCSAITAAYWVSELRRGYNGLEAKFGEPPSAEYYASFYPTLVMPTILAAAAAALLAVTPRRTSLLAVLGIICIGSALYAIFGSGGRFDHDLSHVLFDECSSRLGSVHRLFMVPLLVSGFVMPLVSIFANTKTANKATGNRGGGPSCCAPDGRVIGLQRD